MGGRHAGRRARQRSGWRHSTAGQYDYVLLGRHLVYLHSATRTYYCEEIWSDYMCFVFAKQVKCLSSRNSSCALPLPSHSCETFPFPWEYNGTRGTLGNSHELLTSNHYLTLIGDNYWDCKSLSVTNHVSSAVLNVQASHLYLYKLDGAH